MKPLPDDVGVMAGTTREKQRRLAVADILLWGTQPGNSLSGAPQKWSGWFTLLLHAAIAVSMRAASLRAVKMVCTVFQDTVPGPWQTSESAAGVVYFGTVTVSNASSLLVAYRTCSQGVTIIGLQQFLLSNCMQPCCTAGKQHREGICVALRSISYGPVLPRQSPTTYRARSSHLPVVEQNWVKRMLPRPLLGMIASWDKVAQVKLSVEGISVHVLSTLPNLHSLSTAGTSPRVPPVTDAPASGSQHGEHTRSSQPVRNHSVLQAG